MGNVMIEFYWKNECRVFEIEQCDRRLFWVVSCVFIVANVAVDDYDYYNNETLQNRECGRDLPGDSHQLHHAMTTS